jgi:hypothetical protein
MACALEGVKSEHVVGAVVGIELEEGDDGVEGR